MRRAIDALTVTATLTALFLLTFWWLWELTA